VRCGRRRSRQLARGGFTSCVLTVNAENEKALSLYLDEGFERRAVYTCWAIPNRPAAPGTPAAPC